MHTLTRPILFAMGLLGAILIAGCPASAPQPSPADPGSTGATATEIQQPQPITVNIEVSGIIDSMTGDAPLGTPEPGEPAQPAPESIVFTVELGNVEVAEDEQVGVNFVYEALVPTGDKTYLRENPSDPNSEYRQSAEGPTVYNVIETATGRIESWGSGDELTRVFDVPLPENTYALRYWADVIVSGGDGEMEFAQLPYCTWDEVIAQGELIPPES